MATSSLTYGVDVNKTILNRRNTMTPIEQQTKAFCDELAARLGSARRGTATDLAREVDYTPQMISHVKSGRRLPTLNKAVKLAWFFGETLEFFMRDAMRRSKWQERRQRDRWPNGMRRAVQNLRLVYNCNDNSARIHAEEILKTLARCSSDKQAA